MTIQPGDTLPAARLVQVGAEDHDTVEAPGWFRGRRVALFAVPGAFTPTCSARHLPGFIDRDEALRARGIDEVACTAVNDAFVMRAWGQANNAFGRVTLLADGNGDFARAIGLTMDGSGFGMGIRSQRYAMVVRDGVVEHLFVDAPGAFERSSAEHLLSVL